MFKQRDDFFPSGDTWLGAAYGAIPDNAKFVLVAMLVIIKTLIDVALHKRQHRTVQKKK